MSAQSDFRREADELVRAAAPTGVCSWLKLCPESRGDGFTSASVSLGRLHRDTGRRRGLRAMLFGAALGLACAVSLGGCYSAVEEFEPLEQGEWLVYNMPRE